MMNLGERGVFLFNEGMSAAELRASAARIEALGYGAVWFPEAVGREPFATASFILAHTTRLVAATGIMNIYWRDAVVAAMGQQTLNEMSNGRFLLGLGVSHPFFVEARGYVYDRPVATMRKYVAAIRAAHAGISTQKNLIADGMVSQVIQSGERGVIVTDVGPMPIVLAALGPRMMALAAEVSQGAHPYNTTPEHTARARQILGPGPWLCPAQRVCLTRDASAARAAGRKLVAFYLNLPNYRNNLLGCGFTATDLEHGGSDRLIDGLVAWGDEQAIERRVREHLDAGADHVCIQPVEAARPARLCWRALEALAPGA